MEERFRLLCGKCHVAGIVWEHPAGRETISCRVCGQDDNLDDALQEVALYKLHKGFSDVLKNNFARSRNVTVKSGPKREYRWIGR